MQQLSKAKKALFILILIGIGLVLGLALSEFYLRWRQERIEKSYQTDEGMVTYDDRLGWKLVPNWTGRSRHHDFDVQYNINNYGFRGEFDQKKGTQGRLFAVVGDSFTFCLGVDDADTFVQMLNDDKDNSNVYLNFGMPGFSTDQEFLLIKERVRFFSPDVVLVVVYLGNDLFDNELPFPLQSEHAKPYFELKNGRLTPKNLPVPHRIKPPDQARKDMARIVLGERAQTGRLYEYLNRFLTLRLLGIHLGQGTDLIPQFEQKFKYTLELFWAIIEQINQLCRNEKKDLALVLIPGQSFIKRPRSYSGQFQDYFRQMIVASSAISNVPVIDLAGKLRDHYDATPGLWYYPNDGHFSPEGQRIIADILRQEIANNWK